MLSMICTNHFLYPESSWWQNKLYYKTSRPVISCFFLSYIFMFYQQFVPYETEIQKSLLNSISCVYIIHLYWICMSVIFCFLVIIDYDVSYLQYDIIESLFFSGSQSYIFFSFRKSSSCWLLNLTFRYFCRAAIDCFYFYFVLHLFKDYILIWYTINFDHTGSFDLQFYAYVHASDLIYWLFQRQKMYVISGSVLNLSILNED